MQVALQLLVLPVLIACTFVSSAQRTSFCCVSGAGCLAVGSSPSADPPGLRKVARQMASATLSQASPSRLPTRGTQRSSLRAATAMRRCLLLLMLRGVIQPAACQLPLSAEVSAGAHQSQLCTAAESPSLMCYLVSLYSCVERCFTDAADSAAEPAADRSEITAAPLEAAELGEASSVATPQAAAASPSVATSERSTATGLTLGERVANLGHLLGLGSKVSGDADASAEGGSSGAKAASGGLKRFLSSNSMDGSAARGLSRSSSGSQPMCLICLEPLTSEDFMVRSDLWWRHLLCKLHMQKAVASVLITAW